jgi:hypothetical protein
MSSLRPLSPMAANAVLPASPAIPTSAPTTPAKTPGVPPIISDSHEGAAFPRINAYRNAASVDSK